MYASLDVEPNRINECVLLLIQVFRRGLLAGIIMSMAFLIANDL
jgi:hypothetical protein